MEEYDNSDDLDDDWFYESLMRYNTLQMFYLQNVPQHLLQLDDTHLCIASRNDKCRNTELLELLLPVKLTLPAEDEGRNKGNDFKMQAGMYIENVIYQMCALKNEGKVITSQFQRKGAQMYSFRNDSEGDSERECEILATGVWETPNLLIHNELKRLICSKCHHKEIIVYDINSREIISQINHPFLKKLSESDEDVCSLNNIRCQLLDENTLAVLNSNNGTIALIDLRTENTSSQFDTCSTNDELWTLSDFDYNTTNYFGALSTKGNLCLYDSRNNYKCIKSECFNSTVENVNMLKLKLTNRDRFSISGVDSNIYVYNVLKNSCEVAFTHNGHCQKAVSYETENLINDHIWLSNIGDNFIVSICNNRSLNCWEYNESTG